MRVNGSGPASCFCVRPRLGPALLRRRPAGLLRARLLRSSELAAADRYELEPIPDDVRAAVVRRSACSFALPIRHLFGTIVDAVNQNSPVPRHTGEPGRLIQRGVAGGRLARRPRGRLLA
jgi:hypothetical protein